jgi:hypothetical protein
MKTIEIIFEDVKLPCFAFNIDLASNLIDNVTEETKSWFFHFTVCADVRKSAQASEALSHSKGLLEAILAATSSLKEYLRAKQDDSTVEAMIRSWQSTLQEMIRLSENKKRQVHWIGKINEPTSV